MHFVKLAGFFFRQFHHFQAYNAESGFDDLVKNGTGMSFGEGIRFDHSKGSVSTHNIYFGLQKYCLVRSLYFELERIVLKTPVFCGVSACIGSKISLLGQNPKRKLQTFNTFAAVL